MELLINKYRNAYDQNGNQVASDDPASAYDTYQDYLDANPGGATYDDTLEEVKKTAVTLNTVTNSLKNFTSLIRGDSTPTTNATQFIGGTPVTASGTNYTPFIIAGVIGLGLILLLTMTKSKPIK